MNTYAIHRYGRAFTIKADDEIMERSYANGEFCEEPMLHWIFHNVPTGGIWIDAGANIGNHALAFSQWADLVIAFEPVDGNMQLLRENVINNDIEKKVMCLQLGVGQSHSYMRIQPGGVGRNSQFELKAGDQGLGVHVVSIDSIVPSQAQVRLIKLDVEGMEGQALAGAIVTIARCRPEIFVEIWEEEILNRIRRVLAAFGYKLIERWNEAPTYHFSASGHYPVTYTAPQP